MRDHLLGYPAALNCLPLETRKAHVTPPRERDEYKAGVAWFNDWREMRKINGAADRKVRLEADPPREADLLRPAAPPSTTDKPQGVWVKTSERKPPKPGKYMAHGCTNRPEHYGGHLCTFTADGHWLYAYGDDISWGVNEWLDETPQADADGWIKHDGGECPEHVLGKSVVYRWASGGEDQGIARHEVFKNQPSCPELNVIAYRIVKEPS